MPDRLAPSSALPVIKPVAKRVATPVAERSAVVVDLRDAELARLELLNEALDPLFKEIPPEVELFDRGISQGDVPRLWIDAIAHVAMGRDKRRYRFVQDTRYGRKVLAEANEIPDIVKAVTHYVALRMIERDKALAAESIDSAATDSGRSGWRTAWVFLFGLIVGCGVVFAALWTAASRMAH